MSKYIVTRANILVFFVLVAILIVVGGVTWDRFNAVTEARSWVRHTYDVIGGIKDLDLAIHDVSAGQLTYLLRGDDAALGPYEEALGQVSLTEGALQHQTADNPTQQERLRSLGPLVQRKLSVLAQTVQLRRDGRAEAALQALGSASALGVDRDIHATLALMVSDEEKLLRDRVATASSRSNWVLALVGLLTLMASGMLVWAAWMMN